MKKKPKNLTKKFPSLKNEIAEIGKELESDPRIGESLGNNCYKVRLAIKSKGKGKSGGARIITYVYFEGREVYLLSIYDKSDISTISDKRISDLIGVIRKK